MAETSREDLPGAAALATFYSQDEAKHEFTEEHKGILEIIAGTGKFWHDWTMLKSLLSFRLKQVLKKYHDSQMAGDDGERLNLIGGETYPELVGRLDEALDGFVEGPPFTLQRLCELLLKPQSIYPNISKASLAFEKILLVTSTLPVSIDPYPSLTDSYSPAHENGTQQTGIEDAVSNTEVTAANTEVTAANAMETVASTEATAANHEITAANVMEAAANTEDNATNAMETTSSTEDTSASNPVVTDEEMIDASTDHNGKAETNEQNGEVDAMTESPSGSSCNGD